MSASPERMRTPLQARSQQSTDKMLDAALAILDESGVRGLTLASVSKASGVSNGALYHRFGDRQGLLIAAQDRFLTRLESEWAVVSAPVWDAPDIETLLTRVVDAFFDIFRDNRSLFQAFLITGYDDPSLRARGTYSSRRVAGAVASLLTERGACDAAQADTIYRIIYAYVVLSMMFTEEEISDAHVDDSARRRALVQALLGVLKS